MKRVLLTGMSGTGKSTLIEALVSRGFKAVDLDDPAYSELMSAPTDEVTGPDSGQDWVWRADRVQELLSTEDADILFVSGTSPNQGAFYPQFDVVILLSAPTDVIVERLATRTNNPFGKRPGEIERVLALIEAVEPLLRRGANHEIDTSVPVEEVVSKVLEFAGIGRRRHGTAGPKRDPSCARTAR